MTSRRDVDMNVLLAGVFMALGIGCGDDNASPTPTEPTTDTTVSQADLVVQSVSVSESSLGTGESFTLSATVRNQGSGRSAATTLRYYRSPDATISTGDTEVGIDAVVALAASHTSAESIRLTAPSSGGTYYYGACVADVSDESDTRNNCSTGTRVMVEDRRPDLVVESVSVSESSLGTGESFTLSATVRNQGPGQSAATTLRYYRSADATITAGDRQVGTDAVVALAASHTSAESIRLTAPSSGGTYYYGACVADVSDESDTRNNCSAGARVMVEDRRPDLVVESVSVSESSLGTGESFTLSATVRNQGSGRSAATTLRYYRSPDATITAGDRQVGTDPVGALGGSRTSAESINLTAPLGQGIYYYGACAESVSGESNTDNNCSRASAVSVTVEPERGGALVMAPGAEREYTRSFPGGFSYSEGLEVLQYRTASSDIDDGLLGLSDVGVSIKYTESGFPPLVTISVTEVTFSYNLRVRPTVPSGSTLRATIVYEITSHFAPRLPANRVMATYTVSIVVLVSDDASTDGKEIAGDAESSEQVRVHGSLFPPAISNSQSRTIDPTIIEAEFD